MNIAIRMGVMIVLIALNLLAQDPDKPGYSGTWQLDIQRTRFGQVPQPKNLVLQIEHKEPKIQILMTVTANNKGAPETLKLTTDGKEYAHTLQGQACMASARWYWWEGKRLVVEVNCPRVSWERRLTLDSKGKILTSVLTLKDNSGEKKAYEFFTDTEKPLH
jgi:hypothetical protein